MGVTHTSLTVRDSRDQTDGLVITFLVDSGAEYSVVSKQDLGRLGITPYRKITIVLADGTRRERLVGDAYFEFEGAIAPSPVIFGEKGDEPLLGLVTLESLGLILDPLSRKIEKRESLRM